MLRLMSSTTSSTRAIRRYAFSEEGAITSKSMSLSLVASPLATDPYTTTLSAPSSRFRRSAMRASTVGSGISGCVIVRPVVICFPISGRSPALAGASIPGNGIVSFEVGQGDSLAATEGPGDFPGFFIARALEHSSIERVERDLRECDSAVYFPIGLWSIACDCFPRCKVPANQCLSQDLTLNPDPHNVASEGSHVPKDNSVSPKRIGCARRSNL